MAKKLQLLSQWSLRRSSEKFRLRLNLVLSKPRVLAFYGQARRKGL